MDNVSTADLINKHAAEPPVDVYALAREMGITVTEVPMKDDVAGSIEKIDGGYQIRVNKNHHLNRKRFTVAHELGHYFLHSEKIGDGIVDNKLFRDAGSAGNPYIHVTEEVQANKFAAGLLMPAHLVKRLKGQGLSDAETAKELGVSTQALEIRMKTITWQP